MTLGKQSVDMRVDRDNREPLLSGRACVLSLDAKYDARGALAPFEFAQLPFMPMRMFVIHDVPDGMARGGHAHASGQQLLVCVAGRIEVELRCGGEIAHVALDRADKALLIDTGVWARQVYGPDAVLLVLASTAYDPGSYRDEPL